MNRQSDDDKERRNQMGLGHSDSMHERMPEPGLGLELGLMQVQVQQPYKTSDGTVWDCLSRGMVMVTVTRSLERSVYQDEGTEGLEVNSQPGGSNAGANFESVAKNKKRGCLGQAPDKAAAGARQNVARNPVGNDDGRRGGDGDKSLCLG
ncbi:hypothetical protein ED733_006397 [Metarhizium rileyi]|uniref:Uncharacterized protein n=1 Tax=Metarhizium rileyi (strain RCEF 4871) TaxID=1649241 RepID=A0A5C6GCY9_METRR|nr:hypothetical protein ED733_006397 [Metarhizium rileyi]